MLAMREDEVVDVPRGPWRKHHKLVVFRGYLQESMNLPNRSEKEGYFRSVCNGEVNIPAVPGPTQMFCQG